IGFDTHRHDGHTPFSKSWRQTERRALPAIGAKRNLQKGWYTTFGLSNVAQPTVQNTRSQSG
ncbi:hypothetical protein K1I42_10785, partial [Hydrogenophilus thermoluteolus]